MLVKTKGIVIRSVKYSETSLICDIFTEELGLQTYIISGVRKKNSKIGSSLLQVMSMLEIVAYHRENKTMNRTKEQKPAYVFNEIPFKLPKSAVGLFMAELLQKTIKEATPNQELFDFVWDSFLYLDMTTDSVSNLHLVFMVQLAKYIGLMPGGDYQAQKSYFDLREGIFTNEEPLHGQVLNFAQSDLLYQLSETSITKSHQIKFTRPIRQHLLNQLIRFFQYQIAEFKQLNSHEIFKEVF